MQTTLPTTPLPPWLEGNPDTVWVGGRPHNLTPGCFLFFFMATGFLLGAHFWRVAGLGLCNELPDTSCTVPVP